MPSSVLLGTGQQHVAEFLHAAQRAAPAAGHVDRALRQRGGASGGAMSTISIVETSTPKWLICLRKP
jgi:hypothetical protein